MVAGRPPSRLILDPNFAMLSLRRQGGQAITATIVSLVIAYVVIRLAIKLLGVTVALAALIALPVLAAAGGPVGWLLAIAGGWWLLRRRTRPLPR
jgi:hypothetical protein